MIFIKESCLATVENVSYLKEARDQLKKGKLKLKILIADAQRKRKWLVKKKKIISESSNQGTSNASKLAKLTHPTHIRPPLEDSYPQLYGAIVDKAAAGAGSDFRRGTDVLNTWQIMDNLHSALLQEGYVLSPQVLLLQLIPRRPVS